MKSDHIILNDINIFDGKGFKFGDMEIENGVIHSLDFKDQGNSNLYVIPGLINTHAHVAMSRFRGLLDDVNLEGFLQKTFKLDANRDRDDIFHSTVCGIYEMMNNGITSFFDLYYDEDIIYEACEMMGIRSFLSWVALDREFTTQKGEPLDNAHNFIRDHRKKDSIIYPSVGVQGVYVASEETLLGADDISKKEKTMLHMHLSETRKEVYDLLKSKKRRPVEYLNDLGILSNRMTAAHCVWLNGHEIDMLSKGHVNVSWNSTSNQKLGTGGVPPIPELEEKDVNISIGTDSNGSNNGLNILETAKTGALSIKNQRWDASRIEASDTFKMLTENGGIATGVPDLGHIRIGAPADLNIVDGNHYSVQCLNSEDMVNQIIYSMNPAAIRETIIGGKIIKKDGKVTDSIANQYETSLKYLRNRFRV